MDANPAETKPADAKPADAKPAVAKAPEEKPNIKYDDFGKLDLRVASIVAARPHPNADRLVLLQVKVGEVEKQIVAGIRSHYTPEALIGTQIIIVNNLEPALLRGEESHGMLLAATDEQGVVLVRPERAMTAGSKVK